MKALLKIELERAFKGIWFKITLLICMVIIGMDIITQVLPIYKHYGEYLSMSDYQVPGVFYAWMETRYSAYAKLLHFIFPVLVCIPYSSTIYSDIKNKYIYGIIVRADKKKYFLSKIIVQFMVGVSVVLFTTVTSFIITSMILPFETPVIGSSEYVVYGVDIICGIFYSCPLAAAIIGMLMEAVMFGLIGTLSFCFAYILDKAIVVMISPFIIYYADFVISNFYFRFGLLHGTYVFMIRYVDVLELVLKMAAIIMVIILSYFIRCKKEDII